MASPGFGFASPIQPRLGLVMRPTAAPAPKPMTDTPNPAPGANSGLSMGDVRAGLQKLGIGVPGAPPVGAPGSGPIATPSLPTLPPIGDASSISAAGSDAAKGIADAGGYGVGGDAAAGAGDAAAGGDAIGDVLSSVLGFI